jgi:hypothetical protein
MANFQRRRREVDDFINAAEGATTTIAPGRELSCQESFSRSAMIVVVGQLHVFLEDLLDDWADTLGPNWVSLTSIGKRYVALSIHREISEIFGAVPEQQLADAPQMEKFVQRVQVVTEWAANPSLLALSRDRPELQGFFRHAKAEAINRALSLFRDDGEQFFDWLKGEHAAYRDYFVLIGEAIQFRNDAAHGLLRAQITPTEVRKYRAIVDLTILKAEQFVRPGLAVAQQHAATATN